MKNRIIISALLCSTVCMPLCHVHSKIPIKQYEVDRHPYITKQERQEYLKYVAMKYCALKMEEYQKAKDLLLFELSAQSFINDITFAISLQYYMNSTPIMAAYQSVAAILGKRFLESSGKMVEAYEHFQLSCEYERLSNMYRQHYIDGTFPEGDWLDKELKSSTKEEKLKALEEAEEETRKENEKYYRKNSRYLDEESEKKKAEKRESTKRWDMISEAYKATKITWEENIYFKDGCTRYGIDCEYDEGDEDEIEYQLAEYRKISDLLVRLDLKFQKMIPSLEDTIRHSKADFNKAEALYLLNEYKSMSIVHKERFEVFEKIGYLMKNRYKDMETCKTFCEYVKYLGFADCINCYSSILNAYDDVMILGDYHYGQDTFMYTALYAR